MEMERDSMGAVAKLPASSSSVTTPQGLNAKLLGTEFERHADSEIVNRAMVRLISIYGDPWGRDRSTARVMAQEWEQALGDLPAIVVDDAVGEWVKSASKWPRPADIRSIADRLLRAPIEAAAKRHGMHKARIEPVESMKGFLYIDSPLRSDPMWRQWLDAQHPTLEHFFFRNAAFVNRFEILGLTEFEANYIRHNRGRNLTEHFGQPVGLGIGTHPAREVIWTDELPHPTTPEERERVSAEVSEFIRRMRGDASLQPMPQGGHGANLDGASPEFRKLVGADVATIDGEVTHDEL